MRCLNRKQHGVVVGVDGSLNRMPPPVGNCHRCGDEHSADRGPRGERRCSDVAADARIETWGLAEDESRQIVANAVKALRRRLERIESSA